MGVFFAVAHEHTHQGRGGEDDVDAIFLDDFVEDVGAGEVGCALAEDGGGPGDEGSVDDVAVAHDPANVGGTPENVVVLHVPEGLEMVVGPHHVTAVDVLNALGLAGGAAGVEDVKGVFGFHDLGGAVDSAGGQQFVEVDFLGAQGRPFDRLRMIGFFPAPNDDMFKEVQARNRVVGYALEVNPVAPAVTGVAGDEGLGLGVEDAVPGERRR